MSQIFDALLRSTTEHSGESQGPRTEAPEILRSVEREAALKWAAASLLAGDNAKSNTGLNATSDENIVPSYGDIADGMGTPQTRLLGKEEVLHKFRSLPLDVSAEERLVSITDKGSPTAEAFRLLGVRLRDQRRTRQLSKVLITSTVPQEGKSTVATNLACTLAQKADDRILLVEGDVRRPSLSRLFKLHSAMGLCEWLQGERGLSECIYRIENAGIWILPAGNSQAAPLDLLQSDKLSTLMGQLTSLFDWIIIDSPPILPLADTSIWTRMADGILLVARQGVTEKKQLTRGLQALGVGKLVGALLNCSKASTYSSYYYNVPAPSMPVEG